MESFFRLELSWKAVPVAVGSRQCVYVLFTVRIVDLGHGREQATGLVKTVVKRDRIENIAQQPG